MPANVKGLLDRAKGTVSQFSVVQKTFAALLVAALVLGVAALWSAASKPTMTPLFADISATDASAIVDLLASEGVSYELTDGGQTVLVPRESLYTMRLKAAAAGLPASSEGDGYSLLDSVGMTSSEFQQQTTYTRAIEGELAKTIGAIKGVTAASVKLAMPQDTVFVDEKSDPTASVFVKTKPGSTLSGEQVEAIVHLVSAGIDGMKPTDVSVIDAEGQVLSTVGAGPGGGSTSGKTTEYEAKVASAVQRVLDKVVGTGNAIVSVTAELNYDQTTRSSEEFTATEELPPSSSATTREEYTGQNTTVGGVLGPDNIAVPNDNGETGNYLNESETVNNPINKVVEQTVTAPGSVRRQSVAVAVNATAAAAINQRDLEDLVATAAGIVEDRGDTVAVSQMTFDTTAAEAAKQAFAEAQEAEAAAQRQNLIKQAGVAGIILLLLIIASVIWRRRTVTRRQELDADALRLPEPEPFDLGEDDEDDEPIVPPLDSVEVKRAQIEELAEEQPDEVANLLRGWLGGGNRS